MRGGIKMVVVWWCINLLYAILACVPSYFVYVQMRESQKLGWDDIMLIVIIWAFMMAFFSLIGGMLFGVP